MMNAKFDRTTSVSMRTAQVSVRAAQRSTHSLVALVTALCTFAGPQAQPQKRGRCELMDHAARNTFGFTLGLCLALSLNSVPVRADDAENDAIFVGHTKKEGVIFRAPDSETLAVALTADGKLLARGGADTVVDLWDVASGEKLHTLTGHTVPILKLAFSPDGKTLASITGSWLPNDVLGEVKLWDVATGKERVSLKGHPGRGSCLAFSPDGKTLATAAADPGGGKVKLWDVVSGKEKMEIPDGAWSLAFSPDGKTLATGTESVILWDVTTGKDRATVVGHTAPRDWPRDRSWSTGTKLATHSGHTGTITWVGFAADGKTLASASGGTYDEHEKPLPGQIKLWDVSTAKERASMLSPAYPRFQFFDLAFTADGKTLISAMTSFNETENAGGFARAVKHWDVATGKVRETFWSPPIKEGGHNAGIYFTSLSADGSTVAWGGIEWRDKDKVRIAPQAPGKLFMASSRVIRIREFLYQPTPITGLAEVWEVKSLPTSPSPKTPEEQPGALPLAVMRNANAVDGTHQAVHTAAFSPDSQTVLTVWSDSTSQLWDVETGKALGAPLEHQGSVQIAIFSPDGKTILMGSNEADGCGYFQLWDVKTGKPVGPVLHHGVDEVPFRGKIMAAAFSPDGRTLVTGSFDKTARLWDVATGEPLSPPLQHTNPVADVAFSPDGKTILTQGEPVPAWDFNAGKFAATVSEPARLWDASTGRSLGTPVPLGPTLQHEGAVKLVAVSSNGTLVFTACDRTDRGQATGTVQVWDVKTGKVLDPPMKQPDYIATMVLSPDDRIVLIGNAHNGNAQFWNVRTKQPLGPPLRHSEGMVGQQSVHVAISPDGRTALTTCGDLARLWRVPEATR